VSQWNQQEPIAPIPGAKEDEVMKEDDGFPKPGEGHTPKTHRIGIYAEGGVLRIAPAQCDVEQEDRVVFSNLYAGTVVVMLPDIELFIEPDQTFELAAGGSRQLTVETAALGPYPYAVYDPGAKQFAQASVPIIIVYPKAN
jgi:hypothetical protein